MKEYKVYKVDGMYCQDCVSKIEREVSQLPGVRSAEVSLDTGEVSVSSRGELSAAELESALAKAGREYSLVRRVNKKARKTMVSARIIIIGTIIAIVVLVIIFG